MHVAILAVTTVVFLYTRNFWLCWLVHAALAVLFMPAVLRTPRIATSSSTQRLHRDKNGTDRPILAQLPRIFQSYKTHGRRGKI